MSEAQTLRDKAAHARVLAGSTTDRQARSALEALADELDQQANEIQRQEGDQDKQKKPS